MFEIIPCTRVTIRPWIFLLILCLLLLQILDRDLLIVLVLVLLLDGGYLFSVFFPLFLTPPQDFDSCHCVSVRFSMVIVVDC